jgi:hypothetical protein
MPPGFAPARHLAGPLACILFRHYSRQADAQTR